MPNSAPYGDIFSAATPYTDRVVAQLQQEQRVREANRQRQAALLDQQAASMYGKLRNAADAKDFTDEYEKYKQSKMDLMGMNPKDKDKFLAKQAESQSHYANMFSIANQSKLEGANEEELSKDYLKNPHKYDDNFGTMMAARKATGVKNLNAVSYTDPTTGQNVSKDLTSFQPLMSPYPDFDFGALRAKSANEGKLNDFIDKDHPINNNGITSYPTYKVPTRPEAFYDAHLQGTFNQKGIDAARKLWPMLDKNTVNQNQQDFLNSSPDTWKQWGYKDNDINAVKQKLTISPNDAPPIALSKHEAQLQFLNNKPSPGKDYVDEVSKTLQGQAYQTQKQKDAQAFQNTQRISKENFDVKLKQTLSGKELQELGNDKVNAYNVLSDISSAVKNAKHSGGGLGMGDMTYRIDDPTVLDNFKDLAPLSASKTTNYSKPVAIDYNYTNKKMDLVYTNEKGEETRVAVNPIEYIKAKVKQSYPNKDIGQINNTITKLYDQNNGNLVDMVSDFENMKNAPPKTDTKPTTKPSTQGTGKTGKKIVLPH